LKQRQYTKEGFKYAKERLRKMGRMGPLKEIAAK
jgi:hypothetical protein